MISEILELILLTLGGAAEQLYNTIGQSVRITLQVMGVLSLAVMALDTLTRSGVFPVFTYLRWIILYALIFIFIENWVQFAQIALVVTNLPDALAGSFLLLSSARGEFSPAGVNVSITGSLSTGLDAILRGILDYANYISNTGGTSDISLALLSLLFYALSAAFGAIAVTVLAAAHIGLVFAVGVTPFFMVLLLFNVTRGFFLSWIRMMFGFALIPLVFAGLIILPASVTLDILGELDFDSPVLSLGEALPFSIAAIMILLLMTQVPKVSFLLGSRIGATIQRFIPDR
jgi:type IV secretion system protein VirB6